MARRPLRTITIPIVLGATGVLLSLAMLVGWILVLVRNVELTQQVRANTWLMVGGGLSFIVIGTVIVMFSVFLARGILETQRQDRFIDSVTHELKSPLASLKLCVETLGRRELAPRQRTELQRMMLDDIDRLSFFIDDVLEASRVGYGPNAHACDRVDLGALAEQAATRVRERYGADEAALTLEVEPGIQMFTEVTSLEIVLRNLLDNAVKYSGEMPEVRLVARRVVGDRVLVEVRDRGIGIPRQHIKRVFDRFYRAPVESVHARRGTGLGLYVAASLVRSIGGRLQAESPGPGKGTIMSFSIPRELVPRSRRTAAAPPRRSPA